MKKFDAVIFDMDGVIFDSERAWLECWKELAEKYGINGVEDAVIACTGTTMERTREIILERYGEDFPYDEYAKESSVIFHRKYVGGRLPVKKGAEDILKFLKLNGIKTALASSTRKATVVSELRAAGLLEYFNELITGEMVQRSKPAPDIFLLACEKVGVKPENAYAIEDSYNGIRAAAAAGMRPVMVPDRLAPTEEMERTAFLILPSLTAVLEHLKADHCGASGESLNK